MVGELTGSFERPLKINQPDQIVTTLIKSTTPTQRMVGLARKRRIEAKVEEGALEGCLSGFPGLPQAFLENFSIIREQWIRIKSQELGIILNHAFSLYS